LLPPPTIPLASGVFGYFIALALLHHESSNMHITCLVYGDTNVVGYNDLDESLNYARES